MGIAGGIAAAGVVSAGVSAGASIYGSSQAAGAAGKASAAQQAQNNLNNARVTPYVAAGNDAANALDWTQANGGFTAGQPDYLSMAQANVPDANTMANLVNTPGYQFNLQQGLQATQNSAAARGLGVSGAAMKGAATYATGLADSTYQNQFNNQQQKMSDYLNLNTGQQTNAMNRYNQFAGVASLGENAAVQTGAQGVTATNNAGNYLNTAGQASAAGAVGVGNAVTGAANNYAKYSQQQNYLDQLQAQSGNGYGFGQAYNPQTDTGVLDV